EAHQQSLQKHKGQFSTPVSRACSPDEKNPRRNSFATLGTCYGASPMKLLVTFIVLALLAHARPVSAAEPKTTEPLKLRLGMGSAPAPALPNSVLWLAKDFGVYKRERLDVELKEFQGTPL